MSLDIMESGTLYFFFRPRAFEAKIRDLECVNCFNAVMVTEDERVYRFLMICQKCLPEIIPGEITLSEKNWAFIEYVTDNGRDLNEKMLSLKGVGADHPVNPAAPVGIAKYHIIETEDGSEIVYSLEAPEVCGPVQDMFRIAKEGSLLIKVKNPEGNVPDDANIDDLPQYPEALQIMFDREWIDLVDERLMNYRSAELLLLGTGRRNIEETMHLSFDKDGADEAIDRLYDSFGLNEMYNPKTALINGQWPQRMGV